MSEVKFHHLCHILFFRNKLLGPAITKKEGITQRDEHQEVGNIGILSQKILVVFNL